MNGILLTRLVAYSCAQLCYFNYVPKAERSNKSKERDAWRKGNIRGLAYYKGGGFLKDVAVSFLVDEVCGESFVVHKMVTSEITEDYVNRWLCYVACVSSVFSGDLLPTNRSDEGSEAVYIPRERLKGYLHIGDKWFEVAVLDRAALIDYLREKHFAAKDRQTAIAFDKNKSNTFAHLLRYFTAVEVEDPRC